MTRNSLSTLGRRNHPFTGVIESLFDDAFTNPTLVARRNGEQRDRFIPSVDLLQTEEAYFLKADLPGMTREDINLTVEDSVLTLSGERTFESREDGQVDRLERSYGKFARTFHLPSTVETGKVKAAFDNGVLTVEIPKAEKAKSRQIEIQ